MIEESGQIEVQYQLKRYQTNADTLRDLKEYYDFVSMYSERRVLSHRKVFEAFRSLNFDGFNVAFLWDVVLARSKERIAIAGMTTKRNENGRTENGASFIIVKPEFRRKGLATKILGCKLQLMDDLCAEKYVATVGETNEPSKALMSSVGLKIVKKYARPADGRKILVFQRRIK